MRVWEGTPTSLPHASPHPRPDPIEWSEIPDEEVGAPLARPGSPARRRMLIRDLARAQGVKVTLRGMCALPTCSANGGQHGQRCCSGSSATAARASVGSTSSACPSLQWTATATGSALLALPLPTRRMTRATCSRRMCTRDAVAQRASEQTCAWLSVRRTIHLSSIVLVQYTCCRTKVALLMMSRHRGSVEARHGRTLSKGASVASSQVQNLRCDC